MGGKHKQAQRVKNNARPSSSGRSAERLGAAVPTPFANVFAAQKETGVFNMTMDEPLPQLDSNLDPQFQLVLKKMNKKDGTTKLKALQEFRVLVEMSNVEAVGLVTGLWCRVYVGLLVSTEGRVREAAHRAHEAICKRTARSLAPHVRVLAAPWLAAVHDTHGPAAQAARDSLHAAFPDEKRRADLASRCRRQLLQQAVDALTSETRDERLVSCAMRAAASACELQQQQEKLDEEACTLLKQLLEDKQFWNLKGECERVGWAALLAAVCRDPWREAVGVDGKQVLRKSLPVLWDPSAITAAASLWDVVLLLLPHVGDSVDLKRDILQPLEKQVSDPGPGVVTRLCPVLLPLLAALPQSFVKDWSIRLLNASIECMARSYVQHSRTEMSAAAAAYMDVTQWSSSANALANCVTQVLCIDPAPGRSATRALLTELSKLMRRWHGDLAAAAWNQLSELMCDDKLAFNRPQLADVIMALYQFQNVEVKKRSDQRVKFVEEFDDDTSKLSIDISPTTTLINEDPWYFKRVEQLARKAVNAWLCHCDNSHTIIALLTVLRSSSMSSRLTHDPIKAYDTYILPAIHNPNLQSDLAYLVELAFLLLSPVDDALYKQSALDSFPVTAIAFAVNIAQKEPYLKDEIISNWLHNSLYVCDLYVNLAKAVVSIVDDHEELVDTRLLERALSSNPLLCKKDCLMQISDVFCQAFDAGIHTQQLCEISAIACKHIPTYLAPRLLTVCCSSEIRDYLGDELVLELEEAWQNAVVVHISVLLQPMIVALRKSTSNPKSGCDDSIVSCAFRLILACGDAFSILSPSYLSSIKNEIEKCIALAQHVSGFDTCEPKDCEEIFSAKLHEEEQIPWLNWQQLIAKTLMRLYESNDLQLNCESLDILAIHVLTNFSLVSCYIMQYTHIKYAEQLNNWVENMHKLCKRITELRSLNEQNWWDNAPKNDDSLFTRVAWGACTAYLAKVQLLPSKERALAPRSPHPNHVARAVAALGLLSPRRIPEGDRPLVTARLVLIAASDEDEVSTAVAEALHALTHIDTKTSTDCWILADGCQLLEVLLQRSGDKDTLIDLATVRLAEWSKLALISARKISLDVHFIAAYCRLISIHSKYMTDERASEFEQLFAGDVRKVILTTYSSLVTLGTSPIVWSLCESVRSALPVLLSNIPEYKLWQLSLKALSEFTCIPVKLCAHDFLVRLCDKAAGLGGQAPSLLSSELLKLQEVDFKENKNVSSVLSCVLAWHAVASVSAAWEQPEANRFLQRLLELIPIDVKDDWFVDSFWETKTIENLLCRTACVTFTRWLSEAGATSRAWWINDSNLSASEKQRAERLAAKYVTRRAVRTQLVQDRLPEGVKCNKTGRLIQAECWVEDTRIELRLELGEAWPLGATIPRVEARPAPHRDQLMQLTLAAAAGAPLYRLLRLWKDAVDKRYEGLEECHICFSLLHAATAQLPRLRCPTCRKTFHSACLYRWFSTSNKSTCPICRNLF